MNSTPELRYYLQHWIVVQNGVVIRSFKTNAAANRYLAILRGDVVRGMR